MHAGLRFLSLCGVFAVSAMAAAPKITAVGNGFSFLSDLSPGVLATIYGDNLAGTGLAVTLDKVTCPILYSSASQVNVQLPWSAAVGSANLVLKNSAGSPLPRSRSANTARG